MDTATIAAAAVAAQVNATRQALANAMIRREAQGQAALAEMIDEVTRAGQQASAKAPAGLGQSIDIRV